MANSFDFELTANDEASAAILRIEEVVKNLNPLLDKTRDALVLGGQDSRDNLDELGSRFDVLARNARSGVQFIGDLVPPLKMVGGLTLGLGGAGAAVNVIKNNLTEFANAGYRIDTIAKNVSMTADAFQELTGAMIENGSARDAAESSVGDLFEKANDAVHGRNDGFLALLQQEGIGISKTKEGLADVGKLTEDINRKMQELSPGMQALFGNKLNLSPELLSYLRNTTSEVQRLKDQARRDGLIFSDKDLQNALAFKQQLNQIGAAYDGMLMKGQAWLGQSKTLRASVDQVTQIMSHGLDSATVGSILTLNHGGKQADIIRKAQRDDKFKDTLSWKEKLDLNFSYASEDLIKKLNGYYKPVWRAERLKEDMQKAAIAPPKNVINPTDQALGNTPEQQHLSQLEIQNNLPKGLLDRVWNAESSRGKKLFSSAGAEGPFQFMPATGRDYGLNNRADRLDFNKSSDAAARYLSDLLKQFDGDVSKAVAAYNWGPKRVKDIGLAGAPSETRNYLQRIMPGLPMFHPQGETFAAAGPNSSAENPTQIFSGPISHGDFTGRDQELVSAIKSLNQTMQDSKMQVELTLVDSKTGERRTIVGSDGARVSTSMNFQ
ncbi:lytic transglycosylase domain-containing protein [Serratia sp. PAMC26656]|uniref:lytic transglycosylase domain-containing protein n=1 Tax=Serratia sp. PAMC26656 TaxID=2775909 RepID=UPI0018F540E4|nr:lytic transglycosylase domain-containing protein [Serratia sp. PAMC26656]MBJ7894140.1 lytic transglycosylase domain-containing protein [Serratia sp. PAMC26656]